MGSPPKATDKPIGKSTSINLSEKVSIGTSTDVSGTKSGGGSIKPPPTEAEKQAELHGVTEGGQFKSLRGDKPEGLSQQQFEGMSPALREKYNRQVEERNKQIEREERKEEAKEEAKKQVQEEMKKGKATYDDPEFARQYEASKGLTPKETNVLQGNQEEYDVLKAKWSADVGTQISEKIESLAGQPGLKAITVKFPGEQEISYEPQKALGGIISEVEKRGPKEYEFIISAVSEKRQRVSETGQPLTPEEKKTRGKAFIEGQRELVGLVKSAKESGVPEIILYKAGTEEVITSVPVTDVGKTRYDILKKQLELGKQGVDVEVGYKYTTTESIITSGPRNVIGTYADLVDLGILKKPTTPQEQAKYYAGVAARPIGEYVPSAFNLAELAKGKPPKYEYEPSIVSKGLGGASEALAYTITGGRAGKTPQESFKPFVEEITQRPGSVAVQAPAVAVDFLLGGAAIKGGMKIAQKIIDVKRFGEVKKVAKIEFGEAPFGIEKINKNLYRITSTTEEPRTTNVSEKLETPLEVIRQTKVEKIPGYGPAIKPTTIVEVIKPTEPKVTIPKPIEEKPITDVFVQYGKKAKEAKVIEVVETQPIIPKQIVVEGEVVPATAKLIGVKKTGGVFVGKKPTSKALEEIAKAEEYGKIAQVAETRQAPLKAVLKGKTDLLREYGVGKKQYRTRFYQVETPLGTPLGATEASRISLKSFIKGRKYEGVKLFEKTRQLVGSKSYSRVLKGRGLEERKVVRKTGKTKPYEPPTESRVGAGQSGKALKYGEKTDVLIRPLGQPVKIKPFYDYLGPVLSPTEKQLVRERKVIEEEESQVLQRPPEQKTRISEQLSTTQSIRTQEELRTKEQLKPITTNILSQRPKIKEETKETIVPRLVTSLTPRTETQPRLATGEKLIQTPFLEQKLVQRQETVEARIKTPFFRRPVPPPFIPGLPRTSEKRIKESSRELGERFDFLGGVPVSNVVGIYKERDITYGQKRISKLLGQERREGVKRGRFGKVSGVSLFKETPKRLKPKKERMSKIF